MARKEAQLLLRMAPFLPTTALIGQQQSCWSSLQEVLTNQRLLGPSFKGRNSAWWYIGFGGQKAGAHIPAGSSQGVGFRGL